MTAAAPSPEASIAAFERGDVDAERFDHEAHVHMAWCYLRRYDTLEGMHRFAAALKRLTSSIGAADKYHETVTAFFMLLIAERMARAPQQDWPDFRCGNPDLFTGAGRELRRWYSSGRLDSPLARRQALLPDRVPRGCAGSQGAATTR